MPILHMGEDGEIYEVDSSENNSSRVGARAEYVEDDDVLKLSIKEDAQVINDRKKIDKLKALQHHHAILGQIQLAQKAALERKAKEKELFKKQEALRAEEGRLKLKEAQIYAKALSVSSMADEAWSGVSGNGLTSDGRRPYLDRPSLDWDLFEKVSSDFGNTNPEDAQDDFDFGPLTDIEKHLLNEFENGRYVVTLEYVNPNGDKVPANNLQRVLSADELINIQYHKNDIRMEEYRKSVERGWMYSAIKDSSGNWVPIRVPLVFGLPQYDPEDDRNGGEVKRQLLSRQFVGNYHYPLTWFEGLKPIIIAYHKRLLEKEEQNQYLKDIEAKNQAEQDPSYQSEKHEALNKLNDVYEKASNFSHPMLSLGLIPKIRK